MLQVLTPRRIREVNALFEGHFVDAKVFYALRFDRVPCIGFIGELDTSGAFNWVQERYRILVREVYQHSYFEHEDSRMYFNNTLFVLRNRRMIELGANYAMVLHTTDQYAWSRTLLQELAQFRVAAPEPAPVTRVIGFARNAERN